MRNDTEIIISKEELVKNMKKSTNSIRIMLIVFLFLCLIFKYIFNVPLPPEFFIIEIAWLLLTIPFLCAIRKSKENVKRIINIHFAWIVCEILLMTVIIHFVGGITWLGPFFYFFFPIYNAFIFRKKKRIMAFAILVFCFLSLAFLEYFQIVPPNTSFSDASILHNKSYFITTTLIILGMIVFSFIAANELHKNLENKIKELSKSHRDIEDIRDSLKIRIKAKTKELKDANFDLEEKVQKRTKELNKRVEELEKFQKITVGREIKMAELKEEIRKLKREAR